MFLAAAKSWEVWEWGWATPPAVPCNHAYTRPHSPRIPDEDSAHEEVPAIRGEGPELLALGDQLYVGDVGPGGREGGTRESRLTGHPKDQRNRMVDRGHSGQ